MLRITRTITIDERELRLTFVRASGPGGQNVNKVASAVQLRFDVRRSPSLPEDVRQRLFALAGARISAAGVLTIKASRYRTQERNRKDAIDRLCNWIRKASAKPKIRRLSRPTPASKKRRLDTKQRRGQVKQMRRRVGKGED